MKVIESHAAELELQLSHATADAESLAAEAARAAASLSEVDERESEARKRVGTCFQAREATRAALDEARDAHRSLSTQIQARGA